MKKLIWAAVVVASVPTVHAQEFTASDMGKPDPSRIEAGIYSIDTHHSHVAYDVGHFGTSRFYGLIGGLSGQLTVDPADPTAATFEIEIPITGFTSTSPDLDAHLQTPDFFDAEKYPTARFVSTALTVSGTSVAISGELEMHGVTRPLELSAQLVGVAVNPMSEKLNLGFEATGRIRRSEFGMNYLVPFVSDEVDLRISAVFEK